MKKILSISLFILLAFGLKAQDKALPKVYDESKDAIEQIDQAIEQARAEDKYVICQVGGNWCPWCLRFADFAVNNPAVAKVIEENYIYVHINTSKDNKNMEALKRLENPGRFGYPVFVILDQEGKRLHTQSSAYLEEGKGYNEKKVVEFLLNWTAKAIETIK